MFITTQSYVDIASISVIPRTTGGQVVIAILFFVKQIRLVLLPFFKSRFYKIPSYFQVYYYHPFSALSDPAKLYNDLRWNVTRPQGFEAVMRVRCSQVSPKKIYASV